MRKLSRNFRFLPVLFCAMALCAVQAALGDTNFPGSVTVSSNLIVNGTISVTNIVPNQAVSLSIAGGASSGSTNGGDVVVNGGFGGYLWNGGNVIVQGGHGAYQDSAGSVILQGGDSGYGSVGGDVILENNDNTFYTTGDTYGGHVRLRTSDGTTRFWLQQDGTLNASGSAIVNVGALSLGSVAITNWVQIIAHIGPLGDVSMGSFTNSP